METIHPTVQARDGLSSARLSRFRSWTFKLIVLAGAVLVLACAAVGWFFSDRLVRMTTQGLLRNGTLLAETIAGSGRYSVIARDLPRLEQLVEGALIDPDVAYVLIAGMDGEPLVVRGKDVWTLGTNQEPWSVPLPRVSAERRNLLESSRNEGPSVSAFFLREGQLLPAPKPGVWDVLFRGDALHYDVLFPIRRDPARSPPDLTFGLAQDEQVILGGPRSGSADRPLGLVEIGLSAKNSQRLLRGLLSELAWLTLLIMGGGIAAVAFLSHRLTQPLVALRDAARQISRGDYSASLATPSADEVGDLSESFNVMARSLQERDGTLRELLQTLEERIETRTRELRQANERLQQVDQLKTSLLSNVSHELRTPLTSMKVHLENLLDGVDGTLDQKQRLSLERVQGNLERLRRMIDDLLDLSRLQAGRWTLSLTAVHPLDLVADAMSTLRHFAVEKRVDVRLDVPLSMPEVSVDRDKLVRVLTNLIHNALKFTEPGGHIIVRVLEDHGECVVFVVEDTACGIAARDLDSIFLPFYRVQSSARQIRGSGLGLSITKQLVELHHGQIAVESTVGCGSRFTVTIPRRSDRGAGI
ncbi:MAG TPA: ATP-binding protein [Nitrospiraceae bacterium]|nr:ATP-binding protein [Nitrospiraceae bacterium]